MPKEVTLETLRLKFEKLQKERMGKRFGTNSAAPRVIRDWCREDGFADDEDQVHIAKMQAAARLYIKALDEGLEAAMVWKLTQST